MTALTEPQVWTLIGVFAGGLFGMLTLMSTMFLSAVRAEIGGLRGELGGEMAGLRGEIGALEVRLTAKIDLLDHDVQAIARHVFGEPGA